jgi:uncharacterized repeat protein (TIGR01451 family)
MFSTEFPGSSLKNSVEEELKSLMIRHQKGEILPADKVLQSAAQKLRSDRVARDRAAELKLESQRAAKAKAENDRLARIKQEEDRREKDQLLAKQLAKASIKIVLKMNPGSEAFPVGGNSTVPVEISNRGKNNEELLLSLSAANEFGAILTNTDKFNENITRLKIAAGETFKGIVRFRMPVQMVDGNRSVIAIKAVSTKFSDISFQKEAVIISSAPLVRAVAKLSKSKVIPGERLRYRVTVLNAGSLPAKNLTVRLQLPSQVDFLGASDVLFKQDSNGSIIFNIGQIDIGRLSEINLDVKISDNCAPGQELRGQIDIVNGVLQRKDIFSASASVVQSR